ncbi:uncharacterized protein EI90DRAFT_641660 [Cantharellus anzutake]|uniref:uncharacterized protein n=1 Tax=Cantharellus anzutake TaxID=1750568 RepID=UPI0019069FEB|nr:uncharacterized protein EI90DRAFT_641660 [Cantharellus anzutake]KAF8333214.1 hypothetical protein EI90DRAFT_641660 [Cantharellus anzutake]
MNKIVSFFVFGSLLNSIILSITGQLEIRSFFLIAKFMSGLKDILDSDVQKYFAPHLMITIDTEVWAPRSHKVVSFLQLLSSTFASKVQCQG